MENDPRVVRHYANGKPVDPAAAQRQLESLMLSLQQSEEMVIDSLCGKMGRIYQGEID